MTKAEATVVRDKAAAARVRLNTLNWDRLRMSQASHQYLTGVLSEVVAELDKLYQMADSEL